MMKDDVFIASLVQYGFLDQVYSRIKNELRYLPDMNELRMVSPQPTLSHAII